MNSAHNIKMIPADSWVKTGGIEWDWNERNALPHDSQGRFW